MIKNNNNRTLYYLWGSVFFLSVCFFASCSKEDLKNIVYPFNKPQNFPDVQYAIAQNPVTENGFILGRTLFYDGILSADNSISCGNCHQQSAAFAHAAHALSHGIHDLFGVRNAPAIQNMAFYKTFMWDGGIFNLDLQPLAPIENHVEMGEQLDHVIAKLNQSSNYKKLFKKAFGSEEINSTKMLKALSQFMVSMVSANSRYDKYVRNEPGSNFSADESAGLQLFKIHCSNCHATDLFTDQSFRNNGLPPTTQNDQGRYPVTLNPADKYCFKVPSLRNVEVTGPYMHDGRFFTLNAVLDHYRTGVVSSVTLDPLLQHPGFNGIAITAAEANQIISFLKTLTDDTFIHDTRFAEQ
ncbi:MAG: cytochrome-c peroxidase [Ferruginibacter sp.]